MLIGSVRCEGQVSHLSKVIRRAVMAPLRPMCRSLVSAVLAIDGPAAPPDAGPRCGAPLPQAVGQVHGAADIAGQQDLASPESQLIEDRLAQARRDARGGAACSRRPRRSTGLSHRQSTTSRSGNHRQQCPRPVAAAIDILDTAGCVQKNALWRAATKSCGSGRHTRAGSGRCPGVPASAAVDRCRYGCRSRWRY